MLCRVPGTRQRKFKKNKNRLCRVPRRYGTRQRILKKKENSLPSVALGKEIKKKLRRREPPANGRQSFAECQLDTRQSLCRVPEIWHSAKQALP